MLNRSAGKAPVKLSPETYGSLKRSIGYSVLTAGLFDVTVGPLMDLWDFAHASCAPAEEDIASAPSPVGFRDLLLDGAKRTAMLGGQGQGIDLGGIGKGYAGVCGMEALRKNGIRSAAFSIGGNVSVLGAKPDGTLWSVGVRHPRNHGLLLGTLFAKGKSIVTSGITNVSFSTGKGDGIIISSTLARATTRIRGWSA